jgi:hypothetical protein
MYTSLVRIFPHTVQIHKNFYTATAYSHKGWGTNGSEEQIRGNVELLVNSIQAVEEICPNLQFVTWPTGGKVRSDSHAMTFKLTVYSGMASSMLNC